MVLVLFLRGINVGGHRRFRPTELARQLSAYDVVNIGAAGTLVVRKPGPRAKFLAELHPRLPPEAQVAHCEARHLIRLATQNPFPAEPSGPDVVRFISIFSKTPRASPTFPIQIPATGDWFVRVLGSQGRLVFGLYRRNMKTIGYLGGLDQLFGAPATTRSWATILAILSVLETSSSPV